MNEMNSPNTNPSKGGRRAAPSGKGKKVFVITLVSLLVLALAAVGGGLGWLYLSNSIYPGVSASGTAGDGTAYNVDLSGLSRQQALATLEESFSQITPGQSLDIVVGEYSRTLDLSGVGTRYDASQTTENAYLYGRTGSLFNRIGAVWQAMTQGVAITPAITVDQKLLDSEIQVLASELSSEMSEPAYTLENDVLTLDRGQTGVVIDTGDFLAFVRGRILSGDLSTAVYEPQVEDPDQLDLLLIRDAIEQPMQNPRLDLENDPTGNTILPAQRGISLDVEGAQKVLEETDERFVELPLIITEPTMTTEEFEDLLFRDVLGEGTTSFNASLVGRTTNVKLACDLIDGTILNPGDVFSYNDTVGPRTYERGFRDAIVYVGASAEDGVGGGICQVSSTIYYAMLRADLEVVERKAHSRLVTYVPLGEDATVAWGAVDFRFKNNTDYPIRIDISYGRSSLTVQLVGTKTENKTVQMETTVLSKTPFQTVHVENPDLEPGTSKVKSNGYTGYVTETYRVVYIDGVEVSRTFENKSVYTKYDKIVEDGPAVPAVSVPTTDPTTPTTDPTTPTTDPTTPTTDPTTPTTDPTTPTTDPTTPTTDPTTPTTDPTTPTTDPTTPTTDPTTPTTDPTTPTTDPIITVPDTTPAS